MIQTPWEQIQNYLRNPAKPEEEILTNWLAQDEENKKVLDDLKVMYSITGNIPQSFVPQRELAWQKIGKRIFTKKHKSGNIKMMLQVAASLLLIALGIGGGFFIQNERATQTFTEVFSPFGHKTMVVLPDNSQVWLNGNSRLKYSANFAHSRNVELTGEGFFRITKNPDKLFTVKAKDLRLEVYGTTFNMKSYPEDNFSEISLIEGSVGLFHNEQLLKKMNPSEVITYDSDENKFRCYQGNIDQITSWRADELVLENATFEDVSIYLERWYGVEITLDESLKLDTKLSFKVKTESLIELLSIINHLTPIGYEINGKMVKIYKKNNK